MIASAQESSISNFPESHIFSFSKSYPINNCQCLIFKSLVTIVLLHLNLSFIDSDRNIIITILMLEIGYISKTSDQ